MDAYSESCVIPPLALSRASSSAQLRLSPCSDIANYLANSVNSSPVFFQSSGLLNGTFQRSGSRYEAMA